MKSLFEENGGAYRNENGYYIPNLTLPNEPNYHIGIWGQRRLNYLKKHNRILYINLLTSGKLTEHLCEIDTAANERVETIILTNGRKARHYRATQIGKSNALGRQNE